MKKIVLFALAMLAPACGGIDKAELACSLKGGIYECAPTQDGAGNLDGTETCVCIMPQNEDESFDG